MFGLSARFMFDNYVDAYLYHSLYVFGRRWSELIFYF